MKEVFNKIFRVSLISSIMFLVFGILLTVKTESVIKTVSIVIGALLVIIGIIPIINYFRNRNQGLFASATFLYGVFSIVAGLMLLFNNKIIATIIPIFTGVWMIVGSVNKIQISMALRDNKNKLWLSTFIFSIIILVLGAIFIIDPLKSNFILSKAFGIIICILAIIDIVDCIVIKLKTKNIFNGFEIVKEDKKD